MKHLLWAAVVCAAVVAEIFFPGNAVYHSGWYNVALFALTIVAVAEARKIPRLASSLPLRLAAISAILGSVVAGAAGVANGLFAPDNRTIVGAPGERVRVDGLGTLVFPLADQSEAALPEVTLERRLRAAASIGTRPRNTGSFIVRTQPRDVTYVQARDLRGNHLTITQPQGSVFLSPVLLMQHRQTIEGFDVPFDSFSVPAARRIVKAIAFTPAQAAMLARGGGLPGEPAVLFAVDDENDRPLPGAIALSPGGRTVRAGNLQLSGVVAPYPEVDVISVPSFPAVLIAAILVIGSFLLYLGNSNKKELA